MKESYCQILIRTTLLLLCTSGSRTLSDSGQHAVVTVNEVGLTGSPVSSGPLTTFHRRQGLSPTMHPVQAVVIKIRQERRRTNFTSDLSSDNGEQTDKTEDFAMELADRLHTARIRRRHYRLLTILKNINDRIGRGPSPARDIIITPNEQMVKPVTESSVRNSCGHLARSSLLRTSSVHRRRRQDNEAQCDDQSTSDDDDFRILASSCISKRRLDQQFDELLKSSSSSHINDSHYLWLEFGLKSPDSRDCDDDDVRVTRSRLMFYVHAGRTSRQDTDSDSGQSQLINSTRLSMLSSLHASHNQRTIRKNKGILLMSVYQLKKSSKRHQIRKLRRVGQQRIGTSFVGWTSLRLRPLVQTPSDICRRRRRATALLLQVIDLDSGRYVDPRAVVRTPSVCQSQTPSKKGLKAIQTRTSRRSNSTRSRRPYIEVRVHRQRSSTDSHQSTVPDESRRRLRTKQRPEHVHQRQSQTGG